MTIDEMKERIKNRCKAFGYECEGCPLKHINDKFCYLHENYPYGEADLKRLYKILFGKEETEEKNMEETKTAMTAEQRIEVLRQMSADAVEWAPIKGTCDGYWEGVAYMMSSVLEMGNETD